MFEFGKKPREIEEDDFIEELVGDSSDFMPLFSKQEEDEINKSNLPKELPILAIKNTVLFPGVVLPITIGRDKSIRLIKESLNGDKTIGVVAQKDPRNEDPQPTDMFEVGTVATILRKVQMPDGAITVIIQGKEFKSRSIFL